MIFVPIWTPISIGALKTIIIETLFHKGRWLLLWGVGSSVWCREELWHGEANKASLIGFVVTCLIGSSKAFCWCFIKVYFSRCTFEVFPLLCPGCKDVLLILSLSRRSMWQETCKAGHCNWSSDLLWRLHVSPRWVSRLKQMERSTGEDGYWFWSNPAWIPGCVNILGCIMVIQEQA